MVAALCTLWRQLSVNPAPSCLFRPPLLPKIRACTAVFFRRFCTLQLGLLWAYPLIKKKTPPKKKGEGGPNQGEAPQGRGWPLLV